MFEQSLTNDRKEDFGSASTGTNHLESSIKPSKRKNRLPSIRSNEKDLLNCNLPPPTLNRYLRFDSATSKSKNVHKLYIDEIMTKHDLVTYLNSVVAGKSYETKPGEKISAPNPSDVLFPIDGMKQWPGNERFIAMIESRRLSFLSSGKRGAQVKIAMELIEEISVGLKESFSRFLTKQSYSISPPGVIPYWEVMDLESVLLEIGKAFRSELLFDDGQGDLSMKVLAANSDKNTLNNTDREMDSFDQVLPSIGYNTKTDYDPLAALKNLCDVSASINAYDLNGSHSTRLENSYMSSVTHSDYPSQSSKSDDSLSGNVHDKRRTEGRDVEISRDDNNVSNKRSSGEVSGILERKKKRPLKKQKHSQQPSPFTTTCAYSAAGNHTLPPHRGLQPTPLTAPWQPSSGETENRAKTQQDLLNQKYAYSQPPYMANGGQHEYKNSTVSNHKLPSSTIIPGRVYNPPKLTSKGALMNEGELVVPKGVTVRPSGKWVSASSKMFKKRDS